MKADFVKTQSAGNDFLLFDRISVPPEKIRWEKYVPAICSRRKGVGADGVLLLQKSKDSDFIMRIFNSDGSEVSMCGNGARCCALYYFNRFSKNSVSFMTGAGPLKAEKGKGGSIKLFMTDPADIKEDMVLQLGERQVSGFFINTGVPHFVVECGRLDNIDITGMGRKIRYNKAFAPGGTNADFVMVTSKNSLKIRTYERGVEAETPACGTGVTASAIAQYVRKKVEPPVRVQTEGGGEMKVYFDTTSGRDLISGVYNVRLEGKAKEVFRGTLELDNFKGL